MRAVQITEFGGPEVLTVDVPEPEAGPGRALHDVSTAGVNYADTHHRPSRNRPEPPRMRDAARAHAPSAGAALPLPET